MPADLKSGISASLRELNKLLNLLPPGQEKHDISEQITALSVQAEKIRNEKLSPQMAEYIKATRSVEEANTAIANAQHNIANVSNTIHKVAKVIDLVGKLLIAIGLT